jgi:hypothetical protein
MSFMASVVIISMIVIVLNAVKPNVVYGECRHSNSRGAAQPVDHRRLAG